jgi:hypothetical protein
MEGLMNMDDATLDQWMLEAAQLVKDRNADAAELVYSRDFGARPDHFLALCAIGLVAFMGSPTPCVGRVIYGRGVSRATLPGLSDARWWQR